MSAETHISREQKANPAGAHSLDIVHCPPRMRDAIHLEADHCLLGDAAAASAAPAPAVMPVAMEAAMPDAAVVPLPIQPLFQLLDLPTP
jgi:hypothetical protein